MPNNKMFETVKPLFKDESTILKMAGIEHDSITPGQEVFHEEAEIEPLLDFNPTSPACSYIVIALDLDAPVTALGPLTPVLLWMQSDMHVERSIEGTSYLSYAGHPFIVDYEGPKKFSLANPHRCLFLLYEQPADFDYGKYEPILGANAPIIDRKLFDFEAWVVDAKLGPVVAANYYYCCK